MYKKLVLQLEKSNKPEYFAFAGVMRLSRRKQYLFENFVDNSGTMYVNREFIILRYRINSHYSQAIIVVKTNFNIVSNARTLFILVRPGVLTKMHFMWANTQ